MGQYQGDTQVGFSSCHQGRRRLTAPDSLGLKKKSKTTWDQQEKVLYSQKVLLGFFFTNEELISKVC